jgi:hypothetical protein
MDTLNKYMDDFSYSIKWYDDQKKWDQTEIKYDLIKKDLIKDDVLVATWLIIASFIETTAKYGLVELRNSYKSKPEIAGWVHHIWGPEEVHHGSSLMEYIDNVWPEYNIKKCYEEFDKEYLSIMGYHEFDGNDLVGIFVHCLVEIGTTTFYSTLASKIDEPVLKSILLNSREDEIRHFKYFYKFLGEYTKNKKVSVFKFIIILFKIMIKHKNDSISIAHKYAHKSINKGIEPSKLDYKNFKKDTLSMFEVFCPLKIPEEMFSRLVNLPRKLNKLIFTRTSVMKLFFF